MYEGTAGAVFCLFCSKNGNLSSVDVKNGIGTVKYDAELQC